MEEPSAGKPHARICGGESRWLSYPTNPVPSLQAFKLGRLEGLY